MKGMTKSAPTSVKPMLSGGPAASLIDRAGGMMFGHRLIAKPVKPRNSSRSASRNGDACVSFRSTRSMTQVVATTSTGTGEKMMMLGNENHRVAMLGCVSGVHTLTMTIAATRTSVTGGA